MFLNDCNKTLDINCMMFFETFWLEITLLMLSFKFWGIFCYPMT